MFCVLLEVLCETENIKVISKRMSALLHNNTNKDGR